MMMSFLLILFVVVLMVILGLINWFLLEKGYTVMSREEITSYECGFEHNSLSRLPFSIRYFLLTVIFLIFDLEIVLLVFIPFSIISSISLNFTLIITMMFIMLLLLGLIYEWLDGSLDWIM